MKKLVPALLLLPAAAHAESWSHSISRGLDLYQIAGAGVTVNVICDPARVFGSDNSGIQLRLGAATQPSGDVIFRAGDAMIATTPQRGRIAPDAPIWSAMLDLLATAGPMQIEYAGEVYSLDLKEPAAFSCTA